MRQLFPACVELRGGTAFTRMADVDLMSKVKVVVREIVCMVGRCEHLAADRQWEELVTTTVP